MAGSTLGYQVSLLRFSDFQPTNAMFYIKMCRLTSKEEMVLHDILYLVYLIKMKKMFEYIALICLFIPLYCKSMSHNASTQHIVDDSLHFDLSSCFNHQCCHTHLTNFQSKST